MGFVHCARQLERRRRVGVVEDGPRGARDRQRAQVADVAVVDTGGAVDADAAAGATAGVQHEDVDRAGHHAEDLVDLQCRAAV
jgi:hypothetical protein